MRVLLISPPFERFMNYYRFYYPIGLVSLAAVIEQRGHDVLVYDADYNPRGEMLNSEELMLNYDLFMKAFNDNSNSIWKEIESVIIQYNPDWMGISVFSTTLHVAYKIINIAKKVNRNIRILAGGVHATISPEDLVDYCDYVVQYEAESIINDVIEGKIKDKVIKGKRIVNLDLLPFPAIHKLYSYREYNTHDLSIVLSSRGCPNMCKFCNSYELWDRKVVRKSVDYFIKEIMLLHENYSVNDIFITDDSFSYDRKWLDEFCNKIKPIGITWRCLSRVDMVSRSLLIKMYDAGCRNIKFGIESGSQKILNKISKNIKVEKVLEVSRIFSELQFDWSAFFIIGFPGETVEDIKLTQKLINEISAKSITVNVYTPFPKNRLDNINIKDNNRYAFHSPHNNFTGCIDDETFNKLRNETLEYAKNAYIEHYKN